MQSKTIIETLFAYDDWANQRLFDAAEKLESGGLEAAALEGQRNLYQLLFHIVRTGWMWRNLVQQNPRPVKPLAPDDLPTLAALRAFAQAESRQMKDLLAQLSDAELGTAIQVVDGRGQASSLVIWHMLMQPILHGIQHRSEASLILTRLGQSPGDIDFIFFV